MAGRTLNRRELRRQSDAAEAARPEGAEDETEAAEEDEAEEGEEAVEGSEGGDEETPAKKAKAKTKPKAVRKPRKPKAAHRLRARWGVFDSSMKQLAAFEFKDRAAAEAKVAELLATRKAGTFFLQMVKEPMPEDAAPAPADK